MNEDSYRFQKKLKKMMRRFVGFSLTSVSQTWPAHRAKSTKQWHEKNGVCLFQGWPGNRPNLNPLENLFSQMKAMQSHKRATSIASLIQIALKVWKNITPLYLRSLYESMPRRMMAVVVAEGGHTKY